MKNSKRGTTVFLTMAIIVTALFSGCNKKEETVSNGNEKEFSYWVGMNPAVIQKYTDYNELLMYQEAEKRTGIHVNFIHPTTGQEGEQFNLLLASGKLPDVIEWNWPAYPGGIEKAIDDGLIIEINDLMDKGITPNFNEWVTPEGKKEGGIRAKGAVTASGKYFGFPSVSRGSGVVSSGIIIRQDWLDELGLEAPVTIDEWEEVLTAFKEKKGSKAPFTGVETLFDTNVVVNTWNNAYNVGKGLYIKDGKVKFGPIEKDYRKWIEKMADWYKKGLIDKDYNTNLDTDVNAKMTTGDSGATYGNVGAQIGVWSKMMENDKNYKLSGCETPRSSRDANAYFLAIEETIQQPVLAITTAAKNPEMIAKWADYWYSEEGYELMTYGVEGVTFDYKEGDKDYHVFKDNIVNNPDGLSMSQALAFSVRGTMAAPGLKTSGTRKDYMDQYYKMPQQIEAYNTWNIYSDNARETKMPTLNFTDEERAELSNITETINTYQKEMVNKFVMGQESFDKYDDYINNLLKIGAERYIEINQIAYDRYMK